MPLFSEKQSKAFAAWFCSHLLPAEPVPLPPDADEDAVDVISWNNDFRHQNGMPAAQRKQFEVLLAESLIQSAPASAAEKIFGHNITADGQPYSELSFQNQKFVKKLQEIGAAVGADYEEDRWINIMEMREKTYLQEDGSIFVLEDKKYKRLDYDGSPHVPWFSNGLPMTAQKSLGKFVDTEFHMVIPLQEGEKAISAMPNQSGMVERFAETAQKGAVFWVSSHQSTLSLGQFRQLNREEALKSKHFTLSVVSDIPTTVPKTFNHLGGFLYSSDSQPFSIDMITQPCVIGMGYGYQTFATGEIIRPNERASVLPAFVKITEGLDTYKAKKGAYLHQLKGWGFSLRM